ncbi:pigment-dispersing hormone type 1 [Cloeon dipterum]|uniref:pigment-dispersing hormone type 1 n=1 Tax=Cloeon dipterum TaxID=197152 RepID=UPI0032201678
MQRILVTVLVVSVCVVQSRSEGGNFNDAMQTDPAAAQRDFINHFVRPTSGSCENHYRELASYLFGLAQEALDRSTKPQMCVRKRNSELINSLLGLPKVMNDAGRK